MAVVIPMRFVAADPGRRDRIVSALQDHGISIRRSTVEEMGELYLLRIGHTVDGVRREVTGVLDRDVPGWDRDVEFFWPQ